MMEMILIGEISSLTHSIFLIKKNHCTYVGLELLEGGKHPRLVAAVDFQGFDVPN